MHERLNFFLGGIGGKRLVCDDGGKFIVDDFTYCICVACCACCGLILPAIIIALDEIGFQIAIGFDNCWFGSPETALVVEKACVLMLS